MELYQLKYFVEIYRSGSMTKAAKKLFVSQPAISQALGKLESELGAPLFDRSERNFSVTETGKLLYVYAERIFYELESFQQELQNGIDNKGLTFVGTDERFEQYLLPQFIVQKPNVKVSSKIVSSDMVTKMLQGVNVDIAITSKNDTDSKYHSKYVMDAEVFVLVPRADPLSSEHSLKLMDLAGKPFIMEGKPEIYQSRFNRKVMEMEPGIRVVYLGGGDVGADLQMNRNCFAFTNSYRLMKNDIYPYHKIVKLDEPQLSERVYVTCKRKTTNPNVQVFMDNLDAMFTEFISNSFYTKNGLLHTMANAKQLDTHD